MRVKITEVSDKCPFWGEDGRQKYVLEKTFTTKEIYKSCFEEGYFSAWFEDLPDLEESIVGGIARFKYIEVPEPAPDYCRKVSWWQKIRGYDALSRQVDAFSELAEINKRNADMFEKEYKKLIQIKVDLQASCNSAESMRDHYKTQLKSLESLAISKAQKLDETKFMLSEALRDRDLHAKVADKWQAKLIDQNALLGKRLKFSVGHNHITIVVGNPITLFESFNKITVRAYSQCSKKDTYNWKTGVIQSVENFCEEQDISKKNKREIMKALAKKYPEVFDVHA
jgi:hypothetical protein